MTEDMRERFEKWANEKGTFGNSWNGELYENPLHQAAWQAWQAALSSAGTSGTPEKCPTCGSKERDARHALAYDSPNIDLCNDKWHVASDPDRAEELARRVATQLICRHEHTQGGNDYIRCQDCELEWDYRHRDPLIALKAFGTDVAERSGRLNVSAETGGTLRERIQAQVWKWTDDKVYEFVRQELRQAAEIAREESLVAGDRIAVKIEKLAD